MKWPSSLVIVGSLALACCDKPPVMQDAKARYRVVAQFAADAVEAKARELGTPDVVLLDGPPIEAARVFTGKRGESVAPRVVVIGEPPASATELSPSDAVVIDETGAAVAIDLALLHCSGVQLPKQVPLGTHVLTRADFEKGGAARPGPGDFAVEMLRREHADVLAIPPKTDVVFRLVLVQFRGDDPWQVRAGAEAVAAARRHRNLDLSVHVVDANVDAQNAAIRRCVADGHRAVLVVTDDPATLTAVGKEAREHGVALILLDRRLRDENVACCVGADQGMLGRAAGETIARLLPNGGTIVHVLGTGDAALQAPRRQGFVDSLGLR